MNLFKKFTKDPEPEEFLDEGYDNEYYSGAFKDEDDAVVTEEPAVEEVVTEEPEEVAPEQPEITEPQPLPKKPLKPAKPAVKYFVPEALIDRQKAVAGLADGYIVMLLDVDKMEREVFLRFFDYVMGAVQALEGSVHKINKSTVVLLPYGADVKDLDAVEESAEDGE